MAMRGGPRVAVGSAAWIVEERSSAREMAQSEIEEFSFSARNEMDWLNEHMADIFSENQVNVTELFKTPSKLRGKTPRTARKLNMSEKRVPLSDMFSSTPKDAPSAFTTNLLIQHSQRPNIKIAEDNPLLSPTRVPSLVKATVFEAHREPPSKPNNIFVDSGYHGSQSQDMMGIEDFEEEEPTKAHPSPHHGVNIADFAAAPMQATAADPASSFEDKFASAREEQTRHPTEFAIAKFLSPRFVYREHAPIRMPQSPARPLSSPSPKKTPQHNPSPPTQSTANISPVRQQAEETADDDGIMNNHTEDTRSPSDGSSPIRPVLRKSSLNFASLPAREPLASNKMSLGGRLSRTSHVPLDGTRMSHYDRQTGGKSLGASFRDEKEQQQKEEEEEDKENDDVDAMDVDQESQAARRSEADSPMATHNKTYTQRLQDQISMLSKSQSSTSRTSKSFAGLFPSQQAPPQPSHPQLPPAQAEPLPSPTQQKYPKSALSAPGAFPDDDEDWIAPPPITKVSDSQSPPTVGVKSLSTDVIESVADKETSSGSDFVALKSRKNSPRKDVTPGHTKSASVPKVPSNLSEFDAVSLNKTPSASNPTLAPVFEQHVPPATPAQSPTRSMRDSPLKQVKNKLSSILKSSRGILASSAAATAEGKMLLSPTTTRMAKRAGSSVDSFMTAENVIYPDLTQHAGADNPPVRPTESSSTRRTRASTERERRENKEKEKEAKRQAEQMDKLEKARGKEREKAKNFSKEQERVAEMEKQAAARREQEQAEARKREAEAKAESEAKARVETDARADAEMQAKTGAKKEEQGKAALEERDRERTREGPLRTPAPPPNSSSRPTRTSPCKDKVEMEKKTPVPLKHSDDDDDELAAPSSARPPPSIPRPTTAMSSRSQVPKRAVRPAKENAGKNRQAPTVIRVNTTSSQHSQFHPSNSILAATLQGTLGPQSQHRPPRPASKANQGSIHKKPSLQSLKSSASSSGRPKALELAAKRKEQEERETQRKREAKHEIERKRAAMQEEERKMGQKRKQEKEEERRQAQSKKAAIEKAKNTRAPPPAARSQPNGPPEYADKVPSRPPSRLGSAMAQESGWPVTADLSTTSKAPAKRPLQLYNAGAGHPYQSKEAKRMRMSDEFDEDIDMDEVHGQQRNMKAPPVRPSGGFKKDLLSKQGYANGSVTKDIFKSTVTTQPNIFKMGYQLDHAQLSKGAIPFAPNPNLAGPTSSYKTPARPVGAATMIKSVAKSTVKSTAPRFQDGDAIELPEIESEDDDDDDESSYSPNHIKKKAAAANIAPWADSPEIRKALVRQETMDPTSIFGPPQSLNMEEVFSKHKDRWGKFRARTSSANWSGGDRLTEEEIRKDLQARDKIRKEGGWSYELSRELAQERA